MSQPDPFKAALVDLGEDIAFHAGNLLHRAFDAVCLLALGLLIYVTSIEPASAGLHSRPLFGVSARIAVSVGVAVNSSHAPTACSLTNDLLSAAHRSCTHAMILEPLDI